MGYFVSVVVGSDLIQVWVPQSYDICLLKNINKCATILTLCLSFSFSTVLKFYILAKRSIPAMDEIFVAKVSMFFITLISLSVSCIKFLIGETKPTFNQVSSKIVLCLR